MHGLKWPINSARIVGGRVGLTVMDIIVMHQKVARCRAAAAADVHAAAVT